MLNELLTFKMQGLLERAKGLLVGAGAVGFFCMDKHFQPVVEMANVSPSLACLPC